MPLKLYNLKTTTESGDSAQNLFIEDVIIVGAGPVGLFLACELGMKDVSVLVLERDASPESPWKTMPLGSRGLNTLSIEAFYRRGLINELFGSEERPEEIVKTGRFQVGGHFAGMMLDANKFDLTRWKYRLPGPALVPRGTSLALIDSILTKRAESLGVRILKGVNVTAVHQDNGLVTVQAEDKEFKTKWLVACDGGRSIIRKQAAFEFVGTEPEFTGYSVLCDLEDVGKLKPGFQSTPTGFYIFRNNNNLFVMDFDGGAYDRSVPVTLVHFQEVLRHVSGTDAIVNIMHYASTFTDQARQATTYRKNKILLAGDSAHIHSPLGAQGLNTGFGDAMNLGWKLAGTIKGTAPDDLLDTYTQERHPMGAWALDWTRAQVTVMKPGAFARATKKVIQDLINSPDGTNYFMDHHWGLVQRYDLGDKHPLVGSSVPDFQFADGSRLGPKMSGGRGLIINFIQDTWLSELAQTCYACVDYIDSEVIDGLGLSALLVRPDGIVAWVAEGKIDRNQIADNLGRWFGAAN